MRRWRGRLPANCQLATCPAGETSLNQASSRGHAIFTLSLTRTPVDEEGTAYLSKLHVVDLAGSERIKRTNTQGELSIAWQHAQGRAGAAAVAYVLLFVVRFCRRASE